MAHIFVKGHKPTKVSKEQAIKIKELFDNNAIPLNTVVSLDGLSVRKEDIRYILIKDDEDSQEDKLAKGNKSISDVENQHQDLIDARLKLSPVERAKEFTEFKVFYRIMTGVEPIREELLEAAKLQLAYFKENNWAYPDLQIFIPLVEGKMKPTLDLIDKSMLDILKQHCNSSIGRVSRLEYAKNHEKPNLL